ncbi:hypothetical protein KEM54_003150 [Ascosphaera aggregata]|nr:hypothetical protein KEM54_003150 [Ascosphaera aggregata]
MSADLFAEFGFPSSSSPSQSNRQQQQRQQQTLNHALSAPFHGDTLVQTDEKPLRKFLDDWKTSEAKKDESSNVLFDATTETLSDEEEEWGDFESAEAVTTASAIEGAMPTRSSSEAVKTVNLLDDTAPAESSQLTISKLPKPQSPVQRGAQTLTSSRAEPSLPATLPQHAPVPTTAPVDLFTSVELQSTKSDASCISHAEADTDVESWADSWVAVDDDGRGQITTSMEDSWTEEDWGDFTDARPQRVSKQHRNRILDPTTKARTPSSRLQSPSNALRKSDHPLFPTNHSSRKRTAIPSAPVTPISPSQVVRPTNLPPPSMLLALLPPILDELRDECLESKRRPELLTALSQTIPPFLRTMTRILLGRSVRWKRDSILSQSTRIGPAGSSGRGMKLNSVNKNESIKEEREAVEVMARWKNVGGVLNSTVASGPSGRQQQITVQVPTEPGYVANVKTVSGAEGGIKATHACALCGLKRDERIIRIDDQAFDSFGEWWIDHWGHRDYGILSQAISPVDGK